MFCDIFMKFTGFHTTGKGRARTLGFSTINLHNINTVIMDNGVYAAWATINGKRFRAALFVGESPTFKDKEKSVELFLIDLEKEDIEKYKLSPLIQSKISVETVQYFRPVIKFDSRADLIAQIKKDVEHITLLLK